MVHQAAWRAVIVQRRARHGRRPALDKPLAIDTM
jgi:hypothetical protein